MSHGPDYLKAQALKLEAQQLKNAAQHLYADFEAADDYSTEVYLKAFDHLDIALRFVAGFAKANRCMTAAQVKNLDEMLASFLDLHRAAGRSESIKDSLVYRMADMLGISSSEPQRP